MSKFNFNLQEGQISSIALFLASNDNTKKSLAEIAKRLDISEEDTAKIIAKMKANNQLVFQNEHYTLTEIGKVLTAGLVEDLAG